MASTAIAAGITVSAQTLKMGTPAANFDVNRVRMNGLASTDRPTPSGSSREASRDTGSWNSDSAPWRSEDSSAIFTIITLVVEVMMRSTSGIDMQAVE